MSGTFQDTSLGLRLGVLAAALAFGVTPLARAQEEEDEGGFDCSRNGHLWEDATKEELRDPKLHYRSTKLYFSQELFVKAAREAELAVHLDPADAEYHMRLGMAYGKLECWAAAGNAFAAGLALVANDPKKKKLAADIQNNTKFFWSERFQAGVARIDDGDFEVAAREFEAAIAVDSTDARAYSNLGVAYHSLLRYADAIEAFKAALARDPDDANAKRFYRSTKSHVARQLFGEALGADEAEAMEKLATVVAMYGQVMAQDPPDAEIAEYATMMGEGERAMGQFTDESEAKPHYERAVEHYREAALARHRDAAANGETPPTLTADPDYLEQILNCFVASAVWDSTMMYGQRLVDIDPRSHKAYLYLGEALRNTGRQEEALTYFLVMQCLDPEQGESVGDVNNHFVGLLKRYQPTDDIVTASIENLESPDEIRISTGGSGMSEAWFFWTKGYVDCYYNGRSAGKVEFSPASAGSEALHGDALAN